MELARELWLALPEFGRARQSSGGEQSKMSPGMAELPRAGEVSLHQGRTVRVGEES